MLMDKLKTGFGLVLRNETRCVVLFNTNYGNIVVDTEKKSNFSETLDMYNLDLTHKGLKEYDVMSIYKTHLDNGGFVVKWDEPIWTYDVIYNKIQDIRKKLEKNLIERDILVKELEGLGYEL